MEAHFLENLQKLRSCFNFGFTITSGYRAKEHPAERHKETGGFHNQGIAADIAVPNAFMAGKIVEKAITLGLFKGIGVSQSVLTPKEKRFIHLDSRNSKKLVLWSY